MIISQSFAKTMKTNVLTIDINEANLIIQMEFRVIDVKKTRVKSTNLLKIINLARAI
jgi:hypothetical protein